MNDGLLLNKSQLATAVHTAFKNWGKAAVPPPTLLQSFVLVRRAEPAPHWRTIAHLLHQALDTLHPHDPLAVQLLRLRFVEGQTLLGVAFKLNLSEDQAKRRQREAIKQVAAVLAELETAARAAHTHAQEASLPPPSYTELFGTDDALNDLHRQLQHNSAPWVIALVGLGGLGKTSMAHAAVRRLIPEARYQQIVWHRLPLQHTADPAPILAALAESLCPEVPSHQQYGRLRHLLKTTPHLIILDNLEIDTAPLLSTLQDLAGPTKFLLTSRHHPPPMAATHIIHLAELPFTAVASLLRQQAKAIAQPDLQHASDALLHDIYGAVGGNPLALKLVVGLSHTIALPHILADLTAVHTTAIEQMYRHIYWQAWHSLSKTAQAVLEIMPMTADIGATPDQLQAITSLSPAELWPALTELTTRSLLEIRGTTWARRYGIHRLTESFLQTEIIHWPEK